MSKARQEFLKNKSRSIITEQKHEAQNLPQSDLTLAIFEKYGLGGLHFTLNQKVYRFRFNYIRGENGEYVAYKGFYLTVQQGLNPIETTVCTINSEQELRALYKIITKISIDKHNTLMTIKKQYEDETK
jgi:hypothetical protein